METPVKIDRDHILAMERLGRLLEAIGSPGTCLGPRCKAPILWVQHLNGDRVPYNANGELHPDTCPDRELFRRKRRT